jgi:2Fe-2S ferredoxin
MGQITFIEHSNDVHVVDIENGKSLMELAMENGIPGIDADCGGACACGTCHVYIDKEWREKAGEMFGEESQMLDMTPEKEESSRLSCQITVNDAMDGMK